MRGILSRFLPSSWGIVPRFSLISRISEGSIINARFSSRFKPVRRASEPVDFRPFADASTVSESRGTHFKTRPRTTGWLAGGARFKLPKITRHTTVHIHIYTISLLVARAKLGQLPRRLQAARRQGQELWMLFPKLCTKAARGRRELCTVSPEFRNSGRDLSISGSPALIAYGSTTIASELYDDLGNKLEFRLSPQ